MTVLAASMKKYKVTTLSLLEEGWAHIDYGKIFFIYKRLNLISTLHKVLRTTKMKETPICQL